MTTAHSLQVLAQVSADQMVDCVIDGIAIGFLAWGVLRLSGRTGAVTRFAVWFSALLAIAVVPVAGLISHTGTKAQLLQGRSALTLPHSWATYLFIAWAVIATVSLLQVANGLFRIRQLRRGCVAIDPKILDPLLRTTLRGFDSRRQITLCTSEALTVPAAIGFFKPAVVFPTWAIEELGVAELNSILLHELAHLARWDDWTNLAQKLARALFFFHPAVWWIDSKLSLEREIACDDVVLARTANPRAYAECLVSLTEKGLLHRGFSLVQAAIGRLRQTTLRVTQILDRDHRVATRVGKPVFGTLAVAVFGLTALSPMAPQLVSFDGAPRAADGVSLAANTRNSNLHESPASQVSSNSTEQVRLVNAAFRPDEMPIARPVAQPTTTRPKRVKFVPSPRSTPPSWQQKATLKRAAVDGNETPGTVAPRAQVFLVVMQERVYNVNGQSLMTLSVYRFATVQPKTAQDLGPKKI